MTFNTGNQIGSTDARDLYDNAENFDKALGTTAATWVDRFGVTRDSFEGRLAKGSFYRVGTFAAGYTLTNMRQTLEYSGHEYSWAGTFPKVVAAGSTPATSGGIGAGAWVDRTDLTLRSDINVVVKRYASVSDMVNDTSLTIGQRVAFDSYYDGLYKGGNECVVVAASTGTHDGGSYFDLTGSGLQAKALFPSVVTAYQFGAYGDGIHSDDRYIQSAIDFCQVERFALHLETGNYLISDQVIYDGNVTGNLDLTDVIKIYGDGPNNTKIQADYDGRMFWFKGGRVHISGMIFTNNNSGISPTALQFGDDANRKAISQSTIEDVATRGMNIGIRIQLMYDSSFYRVSCVSMKDGGNGVVIDSSSFDNTNNINWYNCHFERVKGGKLFTMSGSTASAAQYHHRMLFSGCHFETAYYSGLAFYVDVAGTLTFLNCVFTQNDQARTETAADRGILIYIKNVGMADFIGCLIQTAAASTASKLIEYNTGNGGVTFRDTLFIDPSNISASGSTLTAVITNNSNDTDLSGLSLTNCRFGDSKNVSISYNSDIVCNGTRRFKKSVDSNDRLIHEFADFTSDISGAWSGVPSSVLGRYGSHSSMYPVSIAQGAYTDIKIDKMMLINGPAIIALFADTNVSSAGLFFMRGTSIWTLTSGTTNITIGSSPTTGNFGVSVPAVGTLRITNNFGDTRNVSMLIMGAQ